MHAPLYSEGYVANYGVDDTSLAAPFEQCDAELISFLEGVELLAFLEKHIENDFFL